MLFEMEPQNAVNYVLLTNMYSSGGKWEDVARVRKLMREAEVKKEAGCGWVTMKDGDHVFVAADKSHPEKDLVYKKLKELNQKMRDAGYVPQTKYALYDLDQENKEELLGYHSERLAVAFVLTRNSGLPIRIMKNLRVYNSDHEVVEVSKIIVNVPSIDDKIERVDELHIITNEMVRLIETAAVPIMAVDACGSINGWNSKVAELTGLAVEQAIGTPFVDLVDENSVDVVKNMLSMSLLVILVVNACCTQDAKENVVGVCFVGQDITGQKFITDKYTRIQGDYVNIVRSPSALISPIFMTDEHGRCLEWNDAMEKLSGLKREEATDWMLLGEVFTVNSFGCRVKNVDTLTKLRIILNTVIAGQDADKLLFGFFDQQGKYVEGLLSANKRTDAEGKLTGALCFMHVTSPELQYALQVQRISEQAAANSFNKLAYIRQEIKKPLGGIAFMQDLMGSSDISKEQKQLLKTSLLCQEQLTKIVDDTDIESIEECYME
ncbi:hypothetical protein LWI29_013023 [Acer saccharum]|uniref:PAS domain-containing protein n=1 Tax=Acer saccharum TaxID=4024 RepID=A0AA39VQL8_ACESA|nr:hypothetical protein LWI29_013023 [Acer saccharum]